MIMLSPHISLDEMTFSQTAVRLGIPNEPPPAAVEAMRLLCTNVLEPTRAHFGRPVLISSGFRCIPLNRAIGGSPTSQHPLGEASDLRVDGVSNLETARWIRDNLVFDQLIMEGRWVHVSFVRDRARKSVLTAHFAGGKVTYSKGLA